MSIDLSSDVPYLVQYMRITWKEPLISILPPAHPVRFRPGFTNYLAFGLGYQADRALLRRVVKAARARRMEGEGRTIVVVLWHKDGSAPLIRERVIPEGSEWKLSHDVQFLEQAGKHCLNHGSNHVDRFDLNTREWSERSASDSIRVSEGSFVFLRDLRVTRMKGFDRVVDAVDTHLAHILSED